MTIGVMNAAAQVMIFNVYGLDGVLLWMWRGPHAIQGASPDSTGSHLVVGAGARSSDHRRDLFGALIFDLTAPEGSGAERLEVFCPTEGPVFFRQALAPDGRVAVAETPFLDSDQRVLGTYRVTVLR